MTPPPPPPPIVQSHGVNHRPITASRPARRRPLQRTHRLSICGGPAANPPPPIDFTPPAVHCTRTRTSRRCALHGIVHRSGPAGSSIVPRGRWARAGGCGGPCTGPNYCVPCRMSCPVAMCPISLSAPQGNGVQPLRRPGGCRKSLPTVLKGTGAGVGWGGVRVAGGRGGYGLLGH